jgi:hypothetical protein
MNIEEELKKIWRNYEEKCTNPEILKVLKRGFVFSNKVIGDILLTGINPSWNEATKEPKIFGFNPFEGKTVRYFMNLRNIVKAGCPDSDIGYIDLFYYREKEQRFIINFLKDIPNGVAFLAKQLALTQQQIENAKPKLVIVFNKGSHDLWGINAQLNSKDNLDSNIWMGYKFEPVQSEFQMDNLHKITGLIESEGRVAKDIKKTNLVGSFVYFSRYLGQYTKKEIKNNVSDDIKKIMYFIK